MQDRPFVDKVEMPLVTEYATRLSQFRAGSIYTTGVNSQDIIQTKLDLPQLNLVESEVGASSTIQQFGWQQKAFLDQRVRQAYSMSWDRDLFLETVGDAASFSSHGLPIEMRWSSAVHPIFPGYWLDPKGKEFGANARYYQYNVPEAKKLLAAAGYPDGMDVVSTYGGIGTQQHLEILDGFARDAGFRTTTNVVHRDQVYPQWRDALGQFEGYLAKAGTSGEGPYDAIARLAYFYYSKAGVNFLGYSVDGRNDGKGDPQVDSLIEKAQREFDVERQKSIAHELQRYLAEKQYGVFWPGGTSGFNLAWPCLGNFGVYRGGYQVYQYHWWLDETKAPLKQA